MDDLAPSPQEAQQVHDLVKQNKVATLKYIESLRETFPEVIRGLETYSATRLLLYRERAVILQQLKQAVLDKPEAERMIMDVETRMEALNRMPNLENSVSADQLVMQLGWMQALPEATQEKLLSIMQHSIYNAEEDIAKTGKVFCALGIITRGSVEIVREQDGKIIKSILCAGETLGAISLLSGFSADDIKAISLVDIQWLPGDKVKPILASDPELSLAIGKMMK